MCSALSLISRITESIFVPFSVSTSTASRAATASWVGLGGRLRKLSTDAHGRALALSRDRGRWPATMTIDQVPLH